MVHLILLIAAFVLALIEAFSPWGRPPHPPFWPPHLGWLALALYFLALILGGAGGVLR